MCKLYGLSFGNRSAFLISIHHTEIVWPKMIFNVVDELSRSIRYWSSFCWSWNFNIIFLYFSDALLADLQNNVPGSNLQPVNGTNGTSGYGCLKGAKKKEPQVRSEMRLEIMLIFIKFAFCMRKFSSPEKSPRAHSNQRARRIDDSYFHLIFSRDFLPNFRNQARCEKVFVCGISLCVFFAHVTIIGGDEREEN